ncbi:MAG: superoxide dismutase [Prochlorococcaceae cyanobacterium]|jgi:Fe-Mn family superoxide dismutase
MHPRFLGQALLACLTALLLLLPAAPAWAAFSLPPLPYPVEALEPVIDAQTMTLHHDRHHAGYVANLNAQIEAHPELKKLSLDALQGQISRFPDAVHNNGGGHWNHSLFWAVMAPEGQGGAPSAELLEAIEGAFGSLETMQAQFNQAAAGRFGSGWAWLIRKADGSLAITSTANQDNPLMDLPGLERGTPLLGLDVWEHAYYLHYQNRRPDYIQAWWDRVNWNEVNRRFGEAMAAMPAALPGKLLLPSSS